MRLIGVTDHGRTQGALQLADGLTSLNLMLDTWNAEKLALYATVRNVFSLTAGKQTYTLSPSGDFNLTPRPHEIEYAGILTLTGAPQPVELPIAIWTEQDWAACSIKSVASSLPTAIYCDWNWPAATVNLWPIPTANVQLALYTPQLLSQFANLSLTIDLPPGYADALRYNLAVRLAPEYAKTPSPLVLELAASLKGAIKTANAEPIALGTDAGLLGNGRIFNWIRGV